MQTIKKIHHSNYTYQSSYKRSVRTEGLELLLECSKSVQRLYLDLLNSAWWSIGKPYDSILVDFDFKSKGYAANHYYERRKRLIELKLITIIDNKIYVDIAYADYFTPTAGKELRDVQKLNRIISVMSGIPLPPTK
jgi:hypothetical protein